MADDLTPDAPADRGRTMYRRYWAALLRRDVGKAEQIVEKMMDVWTPAQIYLRLFLPALNLSGSQFAANRIGYFDEHFITHQTLRLMRKVRRRFVEPHPTGPLAIAVPLATNSHRIGLRMVCDFLQSENWRIHWLVSSERAMLRAAIDEHRPEALLFSIGLPDGIEPARRLIAEARRGGFRGLIVIGGRSVLDDPSLVQKLGADLTAVHGLELVQKLRRMKRAAGGAPRTLSASPRPRAERG